MKYLSVNGTTDYMTTDFKGYDEIEVSLTPYDNPNYRDILWYMTGYMIMQDGTKPTFRVSNNGLNLESNGNMGTKSIIKWGTGTVPLTSSQFFKAVYSGDVNLKADVYYIKFFKSGLLVANFDMSTGTMIDQTGNGTILTLNGGTWLDDGAGATGTPVTYTYDTMQKIHSNFNLKADFKLSQFTNRLIKYDTEQITYHTTQSHYDTKRSHFENIQTHYDTKQSFYNAIQTLVDTLQIIYHPTQLLFDTKQIFYDNSSLFYDVQQGRFTNTSYIYDTEQVFSEAIKVIIKHVKLTGTRKLHIPLTDNRQLHVCLTGERHLHIQLKGGN